MKYCIDKLQRETLNQVIEKVNQALIDDEFVTKINNNVITFKSPHNMMHSKVGNKYSYARLIKRGKVTLTEEYNQIAFNFKIELFFPIFFGIIIASVSSVFLIRYFDLPSIPAISIILLFLGLLMIFRIRSNIDKIMDVIKTRR